MSSKNDSEGKVRPGLKSGRSNEFTIITTLKPGGAERLQTETECSPGVETIGD